MTYERGFTMGTFGMLHTGHLELLQRCSSRSKHLTVGIIDDALVVARKGRQTSSSVHDRAARIAEVVCVDVIVKVHDTDISALWERHKFDVLFVGDDWADSVRRDPRWEVVVFPRTPNVSTTQIRGDVRFPVITFVNFILLAICFMGIHLPFGMGFTVGTIILYAAARSHYGRIRVHDWLYCSLEEDV